ncbi:MAG: FixH family protein [Steroidobacteraceae bacterium]
MKYIVPALLSVALAGCATRPTNLDLALNKASTTGAYAVALVPPATAPAINQIHSWTVKLSDSAGSPIHGALFTVDGGMPQHGHGLPTKPRVTSELENGTYRLDGMKFSMTGWWVIKLNIQGPKGADTVTFNTVVTSPHKS